MTITETLVYYRGLREGVRRFAWWREGEQQVGSTGKRLADALADIDREEMEALAKFQEKRAAG